MSAPGTGCGAAQVLWEHLPQTWLPVQSSLWSIIPPPSLSWEQQMPLMYLPLCVPLCSRASGSCCGRQAPPGLHSAAWMVLCASDARTGRLLTDYRHTAEILDLPLASK